MAVSSALRTNSYSAKRTVEYCLEPNSELGFVHVILSPITCNLGRTSDNRLVPKTRTTTRSCS